MAWKKVVHFAEGTSHKKQGICCQDYGKSCIIGDTIIGAVADGAGSAKYSDVGAKIAVKTALEYLSSEIHKKKIGLKDIIFRSQKYQRIEALENQESDNEKCNADLSDEEAKNLFTEIVKEAIAALKNRAAEEGYSPNELACTLLVFVATPNMIAAMQIGDGFIVVHPQNSEYKMLFKPDKGEFVNETTFITSTNALHEMQVEVLSEPQQFICASTDGLEKVAIRFSDWSPHQPFFEPLKQYMHRTSNPDKEDDYLNDFLNSEPLNARTNDDKTLLLCLYQPEEQVQQPDLENTKQEKIQELQADIDEPTTEDKTPEKTFLLGLEQRYFKGFSLHNFLNRAGLKLRRG